MFLLVSCSTDLETLQKRGETYYKINSDKPFSGLILTKYESGQNKSKGYLTDGKEDGIWTYWYENGQKSREVDYLFGQTYDGLFTTWYDNGNKKSEGRYKDGMMNDFWTFYHRNGNKQGNGSYQNGNGTDRYY